MSIAGIADKAGSRLDLLLIVDMVERDARVLDVGCGDGTLLELLSRTKNADGRGIEISQEGVNACVARGLAVIQGNADEDLRDYPDAAFDYVILSQTIQATQRPKLVLDQMLRIGRRVIVSFPNFGYWRVRWQLARWGRMPTTPALPEPWYETPNIHLCTISDFVALSRSLDATIERAIALDVRGRTRAFSEPGLLANLLGEQAILMLSKAS